MNGFKQFDKQISDVVKNEEVRKSSSKFKMFFAALALFFLKTLIPSFLIFIVLIVIHYYLYASTDEKNKMKSNIPILGIIVGGILCIIVLISITYRNKLKHFVNILLFETLFLLLSVIAYELYFSFLITKKLPKK